MFGTQSAWYYQALAGIRMKAGIQAWKEVTIAPAVIASANGNKQ